VNAQGESNEGKAMNGGGEDDSYDLPF